MTTSASPLVIDGSAGEGGGQILRTTLALSMVLGRPVRIEKIRAGRKKPGLQRQHRACVQAALAVGGATLEGGELDDQELLFVPREQLGGGEHCFDVGTAGSAILVLQTILPALLEAKEPTRVRVRGGTHNPLAPCFEHFQRSFLSALRRMGASVEARLLRHGFVPAGGGEVELEVQPWTERRALRLLQRPPDGKRGVGALVAHVPTAVGVRELKTFLKRTGWGLGESMGVEEVASRGPGNTLWAWVREDHHESLFWEPGIKGVPAERVGQRLAERVQRFLQSDAPVEPYLADQLLLPMLLAGDGSLRTTEVTLHTRTNAEVIGLFVPGAVQIIPEAEQAEPAGREEAGSEGPAKIELLRGLEAARSGA